MAQVPKKQKTEKIPCSDCGRKTNHWLKASHREQREPITDLAISDGGPWEQKVSSLWVCGVCESAILEVRYKDSDNSPDQYRCYFPPPEMVKPAKFVHLPDRLQSLYRDVVKCFNDGSLLLCTGGLRALVEGICEDKGANPKDKLEVKIKGLHQKGIRPNLIKALDDLRSSGNDALHRLSPLSLEQARRAIRVAEDMINYFYEADYHAIQFSSSVPPRAKAATTRVQ